MATIVYLGNQQAPWCTEVHVTKSLQALGHEVIFLQEDETTKEMVADTVRESRADLFLWTHTWGWGNLDVATLKSLLCPSAFYHLDLVKGILDRESRIDTDPQYRCSYVFMPDGDRDTIAWFKQHGVNYHFSPPAVFHGGCYLAEPDPALKQDIIFLGSKNYHPEWPYRTLLIEKLEEMFGDRFTLYEHSSQKRERALNQLCASAKVSVGDTFCPGYKRSLYFSDRLFELSGRGIVQVFPHIKGIDDYLEDGKEILYYEYNNWVDLSNKIWWLLDHEDERIAMRDAAMKRIKEQHTYLNRLKNVIDVVLNGKPNIYENSLQGKYASP